MNYYKQRINQIVTYDNIRIGKFIEIFQFSFIFTILAVIAGYFTNKYVLITLNGDENILHILATLSIELALLTIIVFYLRKITLLVPSIASLLFTNFKPYTTIELGMWMILVFVFIGSVDKINQKVKIVSNKFDKVMDTI